MYFHGDRIQNSRSKKINAERGYKIKYMSPFKLFRFPNLVIELRNILIKSMGIELVARNHLQPPKTMFLPQIILKITI